MYTAGVAAFFFAIFDAAHFEHGGTASFLRSHALGGVLLGFQFEVIAELFVELLVRCLAVED
jgi:hypothetical protein